MGIMNSIKKTVRSKYAEYKADQKREKVLTDKVKAIEKEEYWKAKEVKMIADAKVRAKQKVDTGGFAGFLDKLTVPVQHTTSNGKRNKNKRGNDMMTIADVLNDNEKNWNGVI